eukprot:scaffold24217_cov113-Cylindrotheca_fusiformis.AAC.3
MQRYILHEKIGNGSFGTVYLATRKDPAANEPKVSKRLASMNENDRNVLPPHIYTLSLSSSIVVAQQVAIKKMNSTFEDWKQVTSLREFQALRDLSVGCPQHLCQIYDIMREQDGSLHFAFEIMPDGTLHDWIESHKKKRNGTTNHARMIPSIVEQVLRGLEHIHSKGYMHRDIKPENLLMNGTTCKVADFSLARDTVEKKKMTSYVSTRWYRAPEIILCAPKYTSAVDLFALGCVVAEMYRLEPLFPGTGEIVQLHLILNLWGSSTFQQWAEGMELAQKMGILLPPKKDNGNSHGTMKLQQEVPMASPVAISLLERLLRLNPSERLTAAAALRHSYFEEYSTPSSTGRSINPVPIPTTQENDQKITTMPILQTPLKRNLEFEDFSLPSAVPVVSMGKENDNRLLAGNNSDYPPPNPDCIFPQQAQQQGYDMSIVFSQKKRRLGGEHYAAYSHSNTFGRGLPETIPHGHQWQYRSG